MKILVLNPLLDADHAIIRELRQNGASVLFAIDPLQAWQMLKFHGESIDLAIVHREDAQNQGEPGFEFISTTREDPIQKQLPIILTTSALPESEWPKHQTGPLGIHAYVTYPAEPSRIASLISQVLDRPLPFGPAIVPDLLPNQSVDAFVIPDVQLEPAKDTGSLVIEAPELAIELSNDSPSESLSPPATVEAPVAAPSFDSDLLLEDASNLFDVPEIDAPSTFRLDAPDLPPDEFDTLPSEPEELQPSADLGPQGPKPIGSFAADLPGDEEFESLIRNVEGKVQGQIDGSPDPLAAENQVLNQEMPYLTDDGVASDGEPIGLPIEDAVVPGGAAVSPDLETLKKYLFLREQDVAVLSSQVKSIRAQMLKQEEHFKKERAQTAETVHQLEESRKRIAEFENEKRISLESVQAELGEIRFIAKAKSDKVKLLELQIKESAEEMNRLKERVRIDIRKIRIREKELENRLEIVKRDSEVLIGARENKIIELKRKLDLLEFNLDLLQDQYGREKEISAGFREKLNRALQAVRVAGGLLNPEESTQSELPGDLSTKVAS